MIIKTPTHTPHPPTELCVDCAKTADDWSRTDNAYLCVACYSRRRDREELTARNKQRYYDALKRGDLSRAFAQASFSRSEPDIENLNPTAWQEARNWNQSTNLYLQGPPGTGKTFLARCILRKFFTRGKEVLELSARRLLKTADRFDEGKGDFARWCDTPQIVLLDDVDKMEPTAARLEALWEFFDRLEAHEARIIVTANIPLSSLAECLTPRNAPHNSSFVTTTLDRLRPVRAYEMTGPSHRGREKKTNP